MTSFVFAHYAKDFHQGSNITSIKKTNQLMIPISYENQGKELDDCVISSFFESSKQTKKEALNFNKRIQGDKLKCWMKPQPEVNE